MAEWFPAIVLTVIFVISICVEPRRFLNAVLLMLALGSVLTALAAGGGVLSLIAGAGIFLLPLLFFGTALFLIINGVRILKRESVCLANSLSLLLGAFMIIGSALSLAGMLFLQDASVWRSLLFLALAIECYLCFSFAAFFLYSWLYTHMPKRIGCDYIIIHGCGLKNGEEVTPLLRGRVDKAFELYCRAKRRPKLVASGGRGEDEKISEAQAMKTCLIELGVPEQDVITEEMSRSTYENLKNVMEMLDTGGVRHRYIFVTNNYHVFRTGLLAKKLGMRAVGVGCKTAAYYWPSAFIREYIAVLVRYKWALAAIVLLWGAIEAFLYLR